MPLTPQDMLQRMLEKLPEKTGKDYAAWVEVARGSGIGSHKALTAWLKEQHGLNHNDAQWIAWGVTDPGRIEQYDRPKDMVDELYSGKKAHLRPVHDALLAAALAAGDGVGTNVCKTYTSVSRGVQFAIVVPRNNSTVDLELPLPPQGRREAFKSSNPRFASRFRVASVEEVDDEIRAALRLAWQSVG